MLCAQVFVPVALLTELPATHLATVRTLVRVDAPVVVEGVRAEETLLTDLTEKGHGWIVEGDALVVDRSCYNFDGEVSNRTKTSIDTSKLQQKFWKCQIKI